VQLHTSENETPHEFSHNSIDIIKPKGARKEELYYAEAFYIAMGSGLNACEIIEGLKPEKTIPELEPTTINRIFQEIKALNRELNKSELEEDLDRADFLKDLKVDLIGRILALRNSPHLFHQFNLTKIHFSNTTLPTEDLIFLWVAPGSQIKTTASDRLDELIIQSGGYTKLVER
jgi:hypothetical protein